VASGASSAGKHAHASLWGGAVAVSLHALVALALMLVPQRGLHDQPAAPVEVDVLPPPLPAPPPPPDPLPPPPDPTPVERKRVASIKPPPPMPNQKVKPARATDEPAAPVFGVTQDSVVAGESPVAVPVGNTLMTKDRTLAKVPPSPLPPSPPPPPSFDPVDEESVAEFPEAYVKPDPEYPEIARRMGIGGKVLVKLGIDQKGFVKSVRVLRKAGYGMDEEAVKVAWRYRFKPARRSDGEPVDIVITYGFTFLNPGR
jgi:periplasmic protein TonB